MRKISPKTVWCALISVSIIMVLGACMKPVDVESFVNDPIVQDIITPNKGSVIIATGSDDGLKAGNKSISGLSSDKYYKIEEMESDVPAKTYFVKADGTLSEELKNIRKVTVNVITGLTNDVTYRVISAEPYTNSAGIQYFALLDEKPKKDALSNGTVTIFENRQSQVPATKCYFNLSTKIDVAKGYLVMKIGTETWQQERTSAFKKANTGNTVTNIDTSSYEKKINALLSIGIYEYDPIYEPTVTTPDFLSGMSIMELPAVNTVHDYVFVEYKSSGVTGDFYILTVDVKPPVGDATITISPPKIPGLDISGSIVASGGATSTGALIGGYKDGWNVSIADGSTAAKIVFTVVTSPAVNVTFNDLLKLPAITSIMGNGISVSNSGQVFTITFDTTNGGSPGSPVPGFPLPVGGPYDTQIEFKYGDIEFNSYHLYITIK